MEHDQIVQLINSRFDSQDERIQGIRSDLNGMMLASAETNQKVENVLQKVPTKEVDCRNCASAYVNWHDVKVWAAAYGSVASIIIGVIGMALKAAWDTFTTHVSGGTP